MPRFLVLCYTAGGTERLMVEAADLGERARPRPPGVRVLGELRVPLSSQLVSLTPPVLRVPLYGEVEIGRIVGGDAVPGVVWLPAPG